MKILAWAFVALTISGCQSLGGSSGAPAIQAAKPKYELMLSGTIDDAPFTGIGVGSSAAHHDITISSAVPVNYFTMQSCHRSIQFSDVIPAKPWYDWSKDSKSFSFAYDLAPTIEDTGDCILRFCAYSKTVGAPPVACAIVDFKAPKYQLPAENICNGADGKFSGTALCHTQFGLIERVRFPGPVVIAPQVTDPTGNTAPYWISGQCVGRFLDADQTLFEYQVPASECVVIFMEKAQPHRRAKLSVIPFDTAQYPGGS